MRMVGCTELICIMDLDWNYRFKAYANASRVINKCRMSKAMPGKKNSVGGGSTASTAPGTSASEPSSMMESALDNSVQDMKLQMARSILGEKDEKKKKKKKDKKKKSTTSSETSESEDKPEFLQELQLQLALKPKQMKVKDMIRYEDLLPDTSICAKKFCCWCCCCCCCCCVHCCWLMLSSLWLLLLLLLLCIAVVHCCCFLCSLFRTIVIKIIKIIFVCWIGNMFGLVVPETFP